MQHRIDDGKVSAEILELLTDCFARLLHVVLAAAHILEAVLVGLVAIGSGFLFHALLLQRINDLLCIFTRLVQKRHILRKSDIRRRAGCIHNQSAAVTTACGSVMVVVVL